MNDESTNHDEKSSTSGKLESLSKDELIKLVKGQFMLKKKLEAKFNDLTEENFRLCQVQQELGHQLDDNESKYSLLLAEIDQEKLNKAKIQQELNIQRESMDCRRNEYETMKFSCEKFEEKISNLESEITELRSSEKKQSELIRKFVTTTVELCQLEISVGEPVDEKFFRSFQSELEIKQETIRQSTELEKNHLQQRVEDLEFFNEEMKLEIDELRAKIYNFEQEKKKFEREIDNYRRQVEDFEEQFLEVQQESRHRLSVHDKSQSTSSSLLALDRSNENLDNNNENDENCQLTKSSSTSSLLLTSDIPSLLHSVGIINSTDDEFSVPLNYESILRLSALLLERCRVLQYMLLKKNQISNDSSINENFQRESIFFERTDDDEKCRIKIRKQEHLALDTIFERLYSWTNQKVNQDDWQITIIKPFDQYRSVCLRLEFDHFKFVPEKVEIDLNKNRSRLDQMDKENRRQAQEIEKLEEKLRSNSSYEQLKQRQSQLEEQLAEQCEKTIQLENLLQSDNIDRIGLNQIEQIQCSYQQLLEKSRIAENLEKQIKIFEETLIFKDRLIKEKDEIIKTLKQECCHEQIQRLEDVENLRLIHLNFEKSKSEMMKNYQNQIDLINNELQSQKKLVELLRSNENNQVKLSQANSSIDDSSKCVERIEIDSVQISDRGELSCSIEESESVRFDKLKEEFRKIQEENEKLRQNLKDLNLRLENVPEESKENIQDIKEKYHKMKILLTRLKKDLQEKNQQPKQNLIDLEFADYEKATKQMKEDLVNKDKEIQDLRDEISNSAEKISYLRREIENLEQQKVQNHERAENLKILLETTKVEFKKMKDLEQEHIHNDDKVHLTLEKLKKDYENSKSLMSQLVHEKQQLIEKITEQHENNQKNIRILEQNLRINVHELEISKKDYDALQEEFNGYKIRAQSVLKQQQSAQREKLPSAIDKQMEMEETIEKLKATLREANNKMQLIISENEILQKEQDRLIDVQAKLIQDHRKKEQELRKQFQQEMEKIENDWLLRSNESQDIIKNLNIQCEAQTMAFKEQLASVQLEHERASSLLENQLQLSQQEIGQMKILLDSFRREIHEKEKIELDSMGINQQDSKDVTLAWSSSQWQSSEESDNNQNQRTSINSSNFSKTSSIDLQNSEKSISSINPPHQKLQSNLLDDNPLERQRLEDELNKTRLRLFNTVELLDESESNNERLTQQISLLKDEIRRIERNVERTESISNLEYLKNVIIKFFTLKSSPERLQLIPVLVTMLKLSSNEQAQLVRIANSTNSLEDESTLLESNSSQNTNNVTNPSWGSYLNIW